MTYISFSLHVMKELARLAPAKTQLMYLGGGTLPKDLKAMGLTGCDFNYGVYLNNPTWLNDIKALKMACSQKIAIAESAGGVVAKSCSSQ